MVVNKYEISVFDFDYSERRILIRKDFATLVEACL